MAFPFYYQYHDPFLAPSIRGHAVAQRYIADNNFNNGPSFAKALSHFSALPPKAAA